MDFASRGKFMFVSLALRALSCAGLVCRKETHHKVPARMALETVIAVSKSLVSTPAANPYTVSLALFTTSSIVLNFMIC